MSATNLTSLLELGSYYSSVLFCVLFSPWTLNYCIISQACSFYSESTFCKTFVNPLTYSRGDFRMYGHCSIPSTL